LGKGGGEIIGEVPREGRKEKNKIKREKVEERRKTTNSLGKIFFLVSQDC
jgi:hypothetical protein